MHSHDVHNIKEIPLCVHIHVEYVCPVCSWTCMHTCAGNQTSYKQHMHHRWTVFLATRIYSSKQLQSQNVDENEIIKVKFRASTKTAPKQVINMHSIFYYYRCLGYQMSSIKIENRSCWLDKKKNEIQVCVWLSIYFAYL